MTAAGGAASMPAGADAVAPLLVDLLNRASVEIAAGSPKALIAVRENFDPGTEVFVNFLPGGDWRTVADTASALRREGFQPVPHLAGRSIPGRSVLAEFLARLNGEAGVRRILVIAGDNAKQSGPFASSIDVIASGLLESNGIGSVGVAGHPEGHPTIAQSALDAALHAKSEAALRAGLGFFVVTQFTFEGAPIVAWLRRLRQAGIGAPVQVGLAGPATVATLVRFGVHCGVGNSLRALRLRPKAVGQLLGKAGPEELLGEIGPGLAEIGNHGVAGFHFFPFGGVAETGEFVARTLERLYREVGRAPAG
jgi:methylenetetrahydrofolate reductase (NADPH)